MTADPGSNSPHEKSSEPKTLGQILFPYSTCELGYNITSPAIFTFRRIWQAETIEEIEQILFSLKMPSRGELTYNNPNSIVFALEKIFNDLMRYTTGGEKLLEELQEWLRRNHSFKTGTPGEGIQLLRKCRERIGKMALEVFLEGVFERNKVALWTYFSNVPLAFTWVTMGPYFDPKPHSLFTFLSYFSQCNNETKSGLSGKIKKFLACVLNEPLTPLLPAHLCHASVETTTVGFQSSNSSKLHITKTRDSLACALVANGMYEECLEYNMKEAYFYLVGKFLDSLFVEQDFPPYSVGLQRNWYIPPREDGNIVVKEAMKKACENKEWAHIWSVLTRMAYKYEMASFIWTMDPNDPDIVMDHTNVSLKLALIFKNGLAQGQKGF